MNDNRGLLSSGLDMVLRNKRYIFWFYVLNFCIGLVGTVAFTNQAGTILNHSLYSDRLLHGFSLGVLVEMVIRPEFGPTSASRGPALYASFLFMIATALFLPGVFQGYASTYRLPREDYFRACGRNLWRYIRLLIVAGIVMIVATLVLFGLHGVLERKAAESTNELLLPEVRGVGLAVIFLIMSVFRIWFDLAEADVVLSDQRAVRKSIWMGLRHALRSIVRLLGSYIITAIVAAILLMGGLWAWLNFVAPESVLGAFVAGQITLILLLIPRFWQRGVIVSYWKQRMMVPVVVMRPIQPMPAIQPEVQPATPLTPTAVVQEPAPELPETPSPLPPAEDPNGTS